MTNSITPAAARAVLARVKGNEFIEAGPHDFRLGPEAPSSTAHWSPYATDPDGRTVWFAATPDALQASPEPFYYLAQYRAATHLAPVPVDALPRPTGAPRRFVFSVGRCGSTLLGRLASDAGLTCLSEPDALTPFALDGPPHTGANKAYAAVLGACLEGWQAGAALAPALVKLRAQHSNADHLALILEAVAQPSFTFVFREPRAWARSMAGHFGLPVERLVALYTAPVMAHAAAIRRRADVAVLRYEAMRGNADTALAALDLPPGSAKLPRASSQAGTRLARPPDDGPEVRRTVDAFMERWPDIRARSALPDRWWRDEADD